MSLYSLNAVTVDGYRVHTGDRTTAATVVTGALVEAEELLVEELRRDLAWGSRTEKLRIYPDGAVYPSAWPITTAALPIAGRALLGAAPDATPFVGVYGDVTVNLATVTYTGGFDDGTHSEPLPRALAHAIYDLARALASDMAPGPAGATQVRVGDVAITYANTAGLSGLDAHLPGLSARVARYRNRWL